MKHLHSVSIASKSVPSKASLLELTQKATVFGLFATAFNTLAGAASTISEIGAEK